MLGWLRDLTSQERRTMLACWGGWTLDGFDQQPYSYIVPTVIKYGACRPVPPTRSVPSTVATSAFGG
jgi:hypothetical protein